MITDTAESCRPRPQCAARAVPAQVRFELEFHCEQLEQGDHHGQGNRSPRWRLLLVEVSSGHLILVIKSTAYIFAELGLLVFAGF